MWAKHLFSQLFGEPDADNDVSPETEEGEGGGGEGEKMEGIYIFCVNDPVPYSVMVMRNNNKCAKIKKIAGTLVCDDLYHIEYFVWYRSSRLYVTFIQMVERGKMFLTMLIMGEALLRRSPQDSGQKITTMMLKSSFKRYNN